MWKQMALFGLVGLMAALIHFSVVSLLVPRGMVPLLANCAGFAVAFGASFLGHHALTLPSATRERRAALVRFFFVAVFGFGLHEMLYWVLLTVTSLDYRSALVLVLFAVASGTFVLSRYWAFADVRVETCNPLRG